MATVNRSYADVVRRYRAVILSEIDDHLAVAERADARTQLLSEPSERARELAEKAERACDRAQERASPAEKAERTRECEKAQRELLKELNKVAD
jgi:hypothetical protein